MRFAIAVVCALAVPAFATPVFAANCPGNPDALGTSRTLVVDPNEHQLLGTMQYRETLPLNDKEVVITFDDGPIPPYSNRVLDTLASECVKATYFIVGKMAKAFPDTMKRIYAEGHTVGTHSNSHPFTFHKMDEAAISAEVENGIANTAAALGDASKVAPFFRIPGLARANAVEKYVSERGIMTWSADFPADDWTKISGPEVMKRALERLEAKGKGILLLHDIQPSTAMMLPEMLRELKARGYKVVHVVPATPNLPKTVTLPEQWLLRGGVQQAQARAPKTAWPAPQSVDPRTGVSLPAPNPNNFGVDPQFADAGPILIPPARHRMRRGEVPLPPQQTWPRSTVTVDVMPVATLPAPGLRNLVPDVEKAVLSAPVPKPMQAAMVNDRVAQVAPAVMRPPQRVNPALRVPGGPGQWPVSAEVIRPRYQLTP